MEFLGDASGDVPSTLLRRMEAYSKEGGRSGAGERFAERADELIAQAELLRATIERDGEPPLAEREGAVEPT